MSAIDVNYMKGLSYGGIPHDEALYRLEETDPADLDDLLGNDSFDHITDEYDDYARTEIIDRAPDQPYLESDQTRRDPALTRSMINLRYNGTRGNHSELPQHPELFLGFTGNDPRGSVNDPRFDKVRGHMESRGHNLESRMGVNDDYHVAERPWTGQSLSYGQKEMHRRMQGNTKVFTMQKDGRPFGRNTVRDDMVGGRITRILHSEGTEGFLREENQPCGGPYTFGRVNNFIAGGRDMMNDGNRRTTYGSETAPWRNSTTDAILAVEKYETLRPSLGIPNNKYKGGGELHVKENMQDMDKNDRTQKQTGRSQLAATMANATKFANNKFASKTDQIYSNARSGQTRQGGPIQSDVAKVYRHVVEDSERRGGDTIQDGDKVRTIGAGLIPTNNSGISRDTLQSHADSSNSRLHTMGAIVRGVHASSAADKRRAQNAVESDSNYKESYESKHSGKTVKPISGADMSRVSKMTEMPLIRSAAASGLEIASYKHAPVIQSQDVRLGQESVEKQTFMAAYNKRIDGKSLIPMQHSSAGIQTNSEALLRSSGTVLSKGMAVGPKTRLRSRDRETSIYDEDDFGDSHRMIRR